MNSDVFYRRHAMPPKQQPVDTPPAEVSPLAVHDDPSQTAQQTPEPARGSMRWVRPSEIPTMVANRYVPRVVDANAAAVRRAQVLPRRAVAQARTARARLSTRLDREGGLGL